MKALAIRRALKRDRDDLSGAFALRLLAQEGLQPQGPIPELLWPEVELTLRALEETCAGRLATLRALQTALPSARVAVLVLACAGLNPLVLWRSHLRKGAYGNLGAPGLGVELNADPAIMHDRDVRLFVPSAVLTLHSNRGTSLFTFFNMLKGENREVWPQWEAEWEAYPGRSAWTEELERLGLLPHREVTA